MRTTSAAERSAVSAAAGHWCFAYLEVTADDGSWTNLGSLALGAEDLDFFNTATLSESIDANTISFSATLKRDIGSTNSLSPFRTDSLVNESQATPGTYAPRLDLHREWRLMVAVVPRDTTPVAPTDYTELNSGVVTKITVDGLSDTITIDGMGMEHDILRAFVVTDRTYSGDMEDVIQDALDDQLGVDVVPLYTPARSGTSTSSRRCRTSRHSRGSRSAIATALPTSIATRCSSRRATTSPPTGRSPIPSTKTCRPKSMRRGFGTTSSSGMWTRRPASQR
jgi:hypothetical protein